MENRKKVYVAGDCLISSLGFTTDENMQAIVAGKSGIRTVDDCALYGAPFQAARICRERWQGEADAKSLAGYTPLEQLFILSIGQVVRHTGIDLRLPDCGLVLATTKGNIENIDSPAAYLWEMARHVAGYFHYPGTAVVISNACISGVSALLVASRWIESGKYRHVIVAGGDVLSRFVVTGFQSFKSVSGLPCRPYDLQRDGLTLGEACGCIALTADPERVKDRPLVTVDGGGITNDANHISGPSRTGDGLCQAIRGALEEAGIGPEQVGFVNAHGTATLYNDEMEAKAIHWAGLAGTPLNSLKAYWGHTLGAAGIIESIACFDQLRKGIVYGTKGYGTCGVSLPLSLTEEHRFQDMQCCVKTASGFGGCNAAVVFSLNRDKQAFVPAKEGGLKTIRHCRVASGKVEVDGNVKVVGEEAFDGFIRSAFKALQQPNMKFYKMDDLSKLGYVAAEWLLKGMDAGGESTGIILANAASSLDTDRKHQDIIDRLGDGGASPAVFVYTLPNVVLGEICIRHGIRGENTFFIHEKKALDFLHDYAEMLLHRNRFDTVIWGWCELENGIYEADLYVGRKIEAGTEKERADRT